MNKVHNSFQAVVIGSGPSGALTAAYLSRAGISCGLIEEGHWTQAQDVSAFSLQELTAKYRNGGLSVALGGPKVSYVEGSCVGGGSEVNSGLYQRSSEEILCQWSHSHKMLGLEGGLSAQFDALEKEFFEKDESEISGIEQRLKLGAEALSWRYQSIPRLKIRRVGNKAFRLKGMSETYIPEALKNGCHLLSGHKVLKLSKNKGQWHVTCLNSSKQKLTIKANVVFVCCGAIHTPMLLLKSGIRKNIGRTLAMHPTLKVVAKFPEEIQHNEFFPGVIQVKEFSPNLSFGCSVSKRPFLAVSLLDQQEVLTQLNHQSNSFGVYYVMLRGPNTGRVRAIPGYDAPVVQYHLSKSHLAELHVGMNNLTQLLKAAGAQNIYHPRASSALSSYHLFATVPAGENVALTAADSFGRIHGNENLFVNDASLFCGSIGVNPQGTIMALARRNILHFLSTTTLQAENFNKV